MPSIRRRFTKEFKLNVVQAYESGISVANLSRQYDINGTLIQKWAQEYQNNPTGAFRGSADADKSDTNSEKRVAELEQMIGRLTMELDFLKKTLKHAEDALKSKPPGNGTV